MRSVAAFIIFMVLVTSCTEGEAQPDTQAAVCLDVPSELVDGIATGLTVSGEGMLTHAQAVRSQDYQRIFFVAAEINGPGLSGNGDIGLWVTNSLEAGGGLIFAVDAMANEFSDWGDGRTTSSAFSLSDHGAREAMECVPPTQR